MKIARQVNFKGLGGIGRPFRLRQPGVASTPQEPTQGRTAHGGFNKFAGDGQQIVQRQLGLCAQVNHQFFLSWIECRRETMRGVAGILDEISLPLPTNRLPSHAKRRHQLVIAACCPLNRCVDRRRSRGILVQGDSHIYTSAFQLATTSRSTARPISNGRRFSRR